MSRKALTIVRTIILIVAVINQFLAACEAMPIPEKFQGWYQFASVLFTAIASALTYWYNNSLTPEAQKADEYLDQLKSGTIASDEGDA